MKKAILTQKVLCSVLAIGLGGLALPLAAQANSGLSDEPKYIIDDDYYIGSNDANDNLVIIDSDLDKGVIGGYAETDDATGNRVSMSGGTVDGYVYGGSAKTGDATDNSISMSGGTVRDVCGGLAYNGNATGNSVSISGGTLNNINGGYAGNDAKGNRVSISGGTLNNIVGGNAENDATDNRVSISGGTVRDVYGGLAYNGNATDNRVSISGGTIVGKVYGGYAGNDATGNSITLSGAADVSRAALYGGDVFDSGDAVSDNRLIIDGWSGEVGSLHNFGNVSNPADEGGIEVKALAGGLDLAAGKTTAFVSTADGITDSKLITTTATDMKAGVALTVSGTITKDDYNLNITPASVRASDQTAITTESRAAAAAFVNQGAEAVSDSISSLQAAEAGVSAFATISGNNSKYDTGSYVDINGWNGIVGVANTKDLSAGKFSYGAFFENGSGNYNTYNEFNGASFRGDGNVVYNGGGLLMRYEQENGVYTEASLRAGTAKNEVSNALEFAGNRYGFKTENAYYGAHIGIGKIFKLDNGKAWDVYGKYFHTHHEGDSVKIAGDEFDFDSVDSDKLRIGARFSEQQGAKLASYYGLAWEYEFSGDAGGTANHHAMYTPSLEGSTVIGEVGFRYTPGKASPWYFDANVKGYVGMQEGISGSVQAMYSF